jgi:hypothetical protein
MYSDSMVAFAALFAKQMMDKQFDTEIYDEAKEKRNKRLNRAVDTLLMSVLVMFVAAVVI